MLVEPADPYRDSKEEAHASSLSQLLWLRRGLRLRRLLAGVVGRRNGGLVAQFDLLRGTLRGR